MALPPASHVMQAMNSKQAPIALILFDRCGFELQCRARYARLVLGRSGLPVAFAPHTGHIQLSRLNADRVEHELNATSVGTVPPDDAIATCR